MHVCCLVFYWFELNTFVRASKAKLRECVKRIIWYAEELIGENSCGSASSSLSPPLMEWSAVCAPASRLWKLPSAWGGTRIDEEGSKFLISRHWILVREHWTLEDFKVYDYSLCKTTGRRLKISELEMNFTYWEGQGELQCIDGVQKNTVFTTQGLTANGLYHRRANS